MPDDITALGAQLDEVRERVAQETDCAPPPPGFVVDDSGVWFTVPAKEGDGQAVWVCGPLFALAETRDEGGAEWGTLLAWHDRDGRLHRWAMPRRMLHHENGAIAAELESQGLNVGTGKSPAALLKQYLGRLHTPQRRRCVTRTGWHTTDTGHVFVLSPSEAFGPDADRIILQSEHAAAATATQARGTLQDWQASVAALTEGNDRLMLAISAALAAPLLDITNEPSGGLHLVGKSQTGKSTALYCAASVWGRADTSAQIRTWRSTGNGMEGVAAETCDALLALDELGMVDGREAGDIVYSLANESGKARAARDGSARPRRIWRTLFLSTGEVTLAAKMSERGGSPMAGQDVRLVSLPADAGKGLGVFQDLHGVSNGADFAVRLREATRACCGTAARAFLEALAAERNRDAAGLAASIDAARRAFLDRLTGTDTDGQVVSVARRFSLIAVAGELARAWGVVPWAKGAAYKAAEECFRAWLADRGGQGAGEDTRAIATVRHFIEQYGESRFRLLVDAPQGSIEPEETAGRETVSRAGFRRKDADGQWEYLILPECWKSEVCKGTDPQHAAKVLRDAGHLEPGDGKNLATQRRLPGHGKVRVYLIKASLLGASDGD
jgi:putative DNA primase/helicase